MASIEDAPPSRWPWLDWWFTPRWRALLTWMGLAWVAVIVEYIGFPQVIAASVWSLKQFHRILPNCVFRLADRAAPAVVLAILGDWYRPFALRLNLVRGVAWLAIAVAADLVLNLALPRKPSSLTMLAFGLFVAALHTLVLLRWRTRPWIPFVAVAAGSAVRALTGPPPQWEPSPFHAASALTFTAWTVAYAALLLYGTRLLKAEERAQRPLAIAL